MEAEEITDVQDGDESDDEDDEVGVDIIEEPEPDDASDNEINVVSDESEADEDASAHDNNESGEVKVESGSSDDLDGIKAFRKKHSNISCIYCYNITSGWLIYFQPIRFTEMIKLISRQSEDNFHNT